MENEIIEEFICWTKELNLSSEEISFLEDNLIKNNIEKNIINDMTYLNHDNKEIKEKI